MAGKCGVASLVLLLLLGACATKPETSGAGGKAATSRGVYKVGRPYQISGVWYYPKEDYDYSETGIASWYGADFHAKSTANGEVYDMNELTAAHRTLPLPSLVRVTNLENGRSLTLRVNDRGPFARGRIIDVSRRGAQLLGFERQGTAKVRVDILASESRQLAQIYRNAGSIDQALAQTPAVTDAQGTSVAVAVATSPLPASAPPPPAIEPAPIAPAPVMPAPVMTVEQVPLAPPAATSAPPPAPPVAAPPPAAPALAAVNAPPPEVVTVEPVHSTQIYVQAGAFAQRANAERVRRNIRGAGPVRVTTVGVSGAPIYRVRVGPLRSVDEADMALARVASAGYPEARIVVE
jgi:rare lipoprotein A